MGESSLLDIIRSSSSNSGENDTSFPVSTEECHYFITPVVESIYYHFDPPFPIMFFRARSCINNNIVYHVVCPTNLTTAGTVAGMGAYHATMIRVKAMTLSVYPYILFITGDVKDVFTGTDSGDTGRK